MITMVKVYAEGMPMVPVTVVPFTNAALAQQFADSIRKDDGLAGIAQVITDDVPTDDDAIAKFWSDLNPETEETPLERWERENKVRYHRAMQDGDQAELNRLDAEWNAIKSDEE